jgi:hypothetical protein
MNRFRQSVALLVAFFASLVASEAKGGAAMWVYKTRDVMASAAQRIELFDFCHHRDITDLFWQVHFQRTSDGGFALGDSESTRAFLREAHAQSIRVHALAGDPSHTLTANHDRVLARVDALVAFNKAAAPEAGFAGLHLDIEPHGLPQWKTADVAGKCQLLTQFVDIHTRAAERLNAADPHLMYGADVVFWLDKLKPDGTPAYPVTYRGVTKDAAKHLLDVVDNVGIMSYRNTAEGKGGIIALVARTTAYADTVKAHAFVGVKMADIGPKMETFFGRSEEEMMTTLKSVDEAYRDHPGYAGLAFFMYEAFKVMPAKPAAP